MTRKVFLFLVSFSAVALAQEVLGSMYKLSNKAESAFPNKADGGALYKGALLYGTGAGHVYVNTGAYWQSLPYAHDLPDFEFATSTGVGMGTVCAGTVPTGTKGELMTFTRTGTAECYSNDGQTLTTVAADKPRISSGMVGQTQLALWMERATTNLLGYPRDLSNAAWTKTNTTCVLNATGMKGVANSASTCTANAIGATVNQTVTLASGDRNASLHIKRGVGTGTVEVTLDGTTWYLITSSLSATVWKRVVAWDAPGCGGGNCIVIPGMRGTVTNPSPGIRFGTSTDSVLVDFAQLEDGHRPTSPVSPGGSTRGDEVAYITIPAVYARVNQFEYTTPGYSISQYEDAFVTWQNATNYVKMRSWYVTPYNVYACMNARLGLGGLMDGWATAPTTASAFTPLRCTINDGVSVEINRKGSTYGALTPANSMPAPLVTRVYLGQGGNFVIRNVCVSSTVGGCPPMSSSTTGTPVAALGDGLVHNKSGYQNPNPWVYELGRLGRPVYNVGPTAAMGGVELPSAACRALMNSAVVGKGYSTVLVYCGQIDLLTGTSADVIFANLKRVYDAGIAAGMKVVPSTILPWSGYSGWTSAKQTQTLALNAMITDYCTAKSITCVDFYNSILRDGTALAAVYDGASGVYVNAAGSLVMAGLWQAAW